MINIYLDQSRKILLSSCRFERENARGSKCFLLCWPRRMKIPKGYIQHSRCRPLAVNSEWKRRTDHRSSCKPCNLLPRATVMRVSSLLPFLTNPVLRIKHFVVSSGSDVEPGKIPLSRPPWRNLLRTQSVAKHHENHGRQRSYDH